MRVLIVEDSDKLRFHLKEGLAKAGYEVEATGDGREGLWHAQSKDFDAIVLDLMLPGMDGLSILSRLRKLGKDTSVLVLTAKDRVEDRVKGLRVGADDYLVKPFSFDELVARLEALGRRRFGIVKSKIIVRGLVIDMVAKVVTRDGKAIDLTAREYSLLEFLALRRGRVLSRTEIEAHICDENSDFNSNVVDAAIYSLRRKIDAADEPSIIVTRRGMGYSMAAGDDQCPSDED